MQHFKVWITPYPHWEWTKCNAKNMMKLNTSTCAFMTWSWMYCCSHHYGLGVCGIYVNSSTVEEGAMGKTSPLQSRGLIHFDWSSLLYLWVCDAIFWVTWCLSSCFHIIFTSQPSKKIKIIFLTPFRFVADSSQIAFTTLIWGA